jgi:hypothetical protein
VVGCVCEGINFVTSVPKTVSGREKGKPIINVRILSLGRSCKRISGNVGLVDGSENRVTPTVGSAGKTASGRAIESAKDAITEKWLSAAV